MFSRLCSPPRPQEIIKLNVQELIFFLTDWQCTSLISEVLG